MKIEIKENSITLDDVEYIKKGQTPKWFRNGVIKDIKLEKGILKIK